jgi:hypothetical protein
MDNWPGGEGQVTKQIKMAAFLQNIILGRKRKGPKRLTMFQTTVESP